MRFHTRFLVLLALAAGALQCRPAHAQEFFVSITGARQGVFHGESFRKGHENQIPGLKYDFQVASPRDAATGQVSGRRQYQPITFQKDWGAATVQIYQALVTNEALTNVTFYFYSPNVDGASVLQFKVTLTNARIVSIHQHVGDTMPDGTLNGRRLEDIAVSFQSITIQNGQSTGGDSLQARAGAKPSTISAQRSAPAKPAARPALVSAARSR